MFQISKNTFSTAHLRTTASDSIKNFEQIFSDISKLVLKSYW